MDVRACRVDDFAATSLVAGDLAVVVVPELGGKLCSIVWQGREILARNPLRPVRYGAPYADFDASGFDECLPSIGPCPYPEAPWNGTEVPDHGEVWSIPWTQGCESGRLRLTAHGVRFPYTFEKTLAVSAAGSIRLDYALTNHAQFPFRYLWSAHPLLALIPGMRIHLPSNTRVRVDWSKGERLGGLLAEHPWPLTYDRAGQEIDLSLILDRTNGSVDKLYTNRLTEGWCALHDPTDGCYVAMLFPSERVPYVGLSINLGGWPVDRPAYYNLGLEPCNGFPDRLDVAVARGDCAVAAPGERRKWHVEIHLGRTTDVVAEVARLRARSAAA
jgi:hypothetical protein